MKKILLVLLCIAAQCPIARCDESPRALYDQGKFSEALTALTTAGLNSAEDYYNAANCMFRLGRAGQALAYFRKAQVLSPQNTDIKYNLSLAEETLKKNGLLPKNPSLWQGTLVPFTKSSPEILLFSPVLILSLLGASILLRFAQKKSQKTFLQSLLTPVVGGILVLWILSAALSVVLLTARGSTEAVIAAENTITARSGPSESYSELFKLPPGTTVLLESEAQKASGSDLVWRKIRFSLGNVGWIMEKDLLTL